MKNEYRPVIKYPGAKWRLADWIIAHMPPHKSYLEPYFGSGAVFFRKHPSRIETINDLDGDIVNLFECIRNDAGKLAGMVAATPYARQEYCMALQIEPKDKYERARRFLVQHWQGHGFRTHCPSGWKNDVVGREYAYAVRYWRELPDWVLKAVDRLKQVQIECRPAIEVIRRFNRPDVLIYADPPYILSTRKMKRQYKHEMSDNDHRELLRALREHKGPVMISGYDNEIYAVELQGWQQYKIETTAEKGLRRTETLWIKQARNANMSTALFEVIP